VEISRYFLRLTPAELVDRYGVHDVGMRRLLVEYLTERETTCDYTTLTSVALHLAKLFWVDLEAHEPGLRSVALSPEQARAWKKRVQTLPSGRQRTVGGAPVRIELTTARLQGISIRFP
jgi:hypothetical protein